MGQPVNRGQKADYWLGGLQWLNDPLAFAFTLILLITGAAYSWTRSPFPPSMAFVPLFVSLFFIWFGVVKFLWALRVRLGCTFPEALHAFMILLGLSWTVTSACVLGLIKKGGVFLRTPKQKGQTASIGSLHLVAKEGVIFGLCVASAVQLAVTGPMNGMRLLLISLLVWQGFIYGSSLVVSRWSQESEMGIADPILLQTSSETDEPFDAVVVETARDPSV